MKLCKKHMTDEILFICLNSTCQKCRLCCVKCIDDSHNQHDFISFRKFQWIIRNTLYHNSTLTDRKEIYVILTSTKQRLLKKVNEVKVQLLKNIQQCEEKIQNFFIQINDSFLVADQDQQINNIFGNLNETLIEEYVNRISRSQQYIFQNAHITQKMSDSLINIYQKSFQQSKDTVTNCFQSLLNNLNSLRITPSNDSPINRFHKSYKAPSLKVSDSQTMVVRHLGSSNQQYDLGNSPMALLEKPFDPIHNQVSFSITNQSQNKNILMGVCIYDIVKSYNFQNCTTLGRGIYSIFQYGGQTVAYSYSHHDQAYYNHPIGFNFEVGQVITVQVDYTQSLVRFKKGQSIFEMPVILNKGSLYGFVGPNYSGDSIIVL